LLLIETGNSLSFAHAVAETCGLKVEERDDEIIVCGAPAPATPLAGTSPVWNVFFCDLRFSSSACVVPFTGRKKR